MHFQVLYDISHVLEFYKLVYYLLDIAKKAVVLLIFVDILFYRPYNFLYEYKLLNNRVKICCI